MDVPLPQQQRKKTYLTDIGRAYLDSITTESQYTLGIQRLEDWVKNHQSELNAKENKNQKRFMDAMQKFFKLKRPDSLFTIKLIVSLETGTIYDELNLLPWDIFKTIMSNAGLILLYGFENYVPSNYRLMSMRKFHFQDNEVLLPVTITIDKRDNVHLLTEEQFLGMAWFLYNHPDYDIQLSMFGELFDLENYFVESHNLIMDPNRAIYDQSAYRSQYLRYDEENVTITFNTPNFLQGYLTMCEWVGLIDCQDDFSDLRQFIGDDLTRTERQIGRPIVI